MKGFCPLKGARCTLQNKYSLKLVKSTSYDPWFNLALEEHLFRNIQKDEVMLFLWQNHQTVVIGRNQNPWRECRYGTLEDEGGKLARRLSGGGAVYHDLGNLNFTFIAREASFDIEKHLKVIIGAVKNQGVNAAFSGRNDILAEGRKFSGNAYYYDGDHCYHHGTLLVSSDLSKLGRYLQVSKEKIRSKGIESVEARVVNLNQINAGITIDGLCRALEKSFETTYGDKIKERLIIGEDFAGLEEGYERYSSWAWRYGETPNFQINFYNRFSWGDLDVNFNLKDGIIEEAAVFSDSTDVQLIQRVKQAFIGLKFTKEDILLKLRELKASDAVEIMEEIEAWFGKQEI